MLKFTFIKMLGLISPFIMQQLLSFQLVTDVFSVLRYFDEWAMVTSCTGITKTYCHLSSFITDYGAGYKVRVQLVAGDDESMWTSKKFLPNTSRHGCMSVWCSMIKIMCILIQAHNMVILNMNPYLSLFL